MIKIFEEAVYMSIALVYYFRLKDTESDDLPDTRDVFSTHMSGVFDRHPTYFKEQVDEYVRKFVSDKHFAIPSGIASNRALRENIFLMVCCLETHLPLGIIGEPGTSKTLSFHIVLANLRGGDSQKSFCRQFRSLDPFFLLCNPNTTSNEVTTTYLRAIERSQSYEKTGAQINVVVFLDEGR
jgi:hemicentin